MSEIEIRRLFPADAAVYRELRLRALKEFPDAFTSSFEEAVGKPLASTEERLRDQGREAVYGAFIDGKLAGMVGLGREERVKNRHKATVFGMYVAPEQARRGVAKALLRAIIDQARQMSLEQIILTVTDTNVPASTLYESFGFRSFGVEPRAICVNGVYYDKNHMILRLAQP